MVTGDHPVTALAISRDLGLTEDETTVVTGADMISAGDEVFDPFSQLVAIRLS